MAFSRRKFLAGVAAAPIAGLGARSLFGASSKPRVAVVGAGAFGGWTALHLRRMGAEVVLIDTWGPGNSLSSSGGKTRVIRSIYGPDRIYSEMVKRAFPQWEKLAASSPSEPLYVETGALWMERGDDSYVRAALPIVRELGFPVDELKVPEAAKRYPQINFEGVRTAYFEQKAGALLARRACVVVRDTFVNEGGTYRTAEAKAGPVAKGKMTSLRLGDGSHVEADAYVFACGPWLGQVFPKVIDGRVRPTRQEVYYFTIPSDAYAAPNLPIWIDFGRHIVYGIPGVDGRFFKYADDTRGATIDPTTMKRTPSAEGIEMARKFLAERFPAIAKEPLLSAEVCQYENSPDGNLIIDRDPEASNVWIAGGGSGHGFKLSPVVGEMVADAVLQRKEPPKTFSLERLRQSKTQFDVNRQ